MLWISAFLLVDASSGRFGCDCVSCHVAQANGAILVTTWNMARGDFPPKLPWAVCLRMFITSYYPHNCLWGIKTLESTRHLRRAARSTRKMETCGTSHVVDLSSLWKFSYMGKLNSADCWKPVIAPNQLGTTRETPLKHLPREEKKTHSTKTGW